jgi:hypothetical protein
MPLVKAPGGTERAWILDQGHYFGRQAIVLHEKCSIRFQHVHE